MKHEACPVCGHPAEDHFSVDLYEVIARWLCAYGREPLPSGTRIEEVAAGVRRCLTNDRAEHDRLVAAALAATDYIGQSLLTQMLLHDVDGHA